ncbi:hypothetical protein [Halocynthiibacter namhaensis]|uniref:hypothetical protein n=1 Tax=Halocynthiibacter namhaensis TaxID=1290553 RepID=UPI0005790BFB|nr:hypothetical protein [Halocynthiibacter namhaensis]
MFWFILIFVALTYWCLRNNPVYHRIAFSVTITAFAFGAAFASLTRSSNGGSWIAFGLMLLPWMTQFLFAPGRKKPIQHWLSLGWIALAIVFLFLWISTQSFLSLRSAQTTPLMVAFLSWVISALLLFFTPPKAWPQNLKAWRIPFAFIGTVQVLAIVSVFTLSHYISIRAKAIAGDQACIIDPTGRSFKHSYWISPGRILQNNYRYMTLPWLLLETNGEATHHWSFRNLDFMSNDGHWAFYIPAARRKAALSGLQTSPCGSQETTQRLP